MVAMNTEIRIAITATFLALAVGLATASTPAVASFDRSGVAVGRVSETPAEVRSSWSPAEMLDAAANGSPAPAPRLLGGEDPVARSAASTEGDFTPADPTAPPWRVHGKVFLRIDGEGFACSGTLVDSAGRNVVATAGHCVYDRKTRSFVEDLTFVPAWRGDASGGEDRSPFGQWPARRIVTTGEYRLTGQLGSDVAFFAVQGQPARELGSRKIAFGLDMVGRKVTILGYPAEPSELFDGKTLKGCSSTVAGRDNGNAARLIFPAALWARPCSMGAGSSGGGWVTSAGFLASIVSYGYCPTSPGLCDSTFGPVLESGAKALFRSAAIGGSRKPSATVQPGPAIERGRRSISFRVGGSGSTPVSKWCRLDRRPATRCSDFVTFRNLRAGRHVFGVRAIDQTGRRSDETRVSFTIAVR